MVRGERSRDLVASEQITRVTRVLSEHEGDFLQHLDRPERKIPHVSDGGADDIQRTGALGLAHIPFQGIWSYNPADWNMWRRSHVRSLRSASGDIASWSTAAHMTSRIQ